MERLSPGHPAWIEIDLRQFKKNLQLIRQHVGGAKVCIPIKANAYGMGLVPIARALVEANIDYLGVSCLQEGISLREAGINIPILIFGAIHENQIADLLKYQIEISISSRFKAELVAKECLRLKTQCRVHLEVETGMQRTGVRPTTARELLNYLLGNKNFKVVGVYSHLATADQPHNSAALEQIQAFLRFREESIKDSSIIWHLANSGGVAYYPESYLDMVRPGVLVFGYDPIYRDPLLGQIAPIFSVKAKISYFKVVGKGQGISYGHTYRAAQDTRVVTVPIGYGDGYRRALSNKAHVLIRGKRYPVVGNVNMDQIMVDIGQGEAYVGDEVVLIGKQGDEEIRLAEIVKHCDSITHEILCGFNNRLPRVYI